jgi:hypothetical protein
MKLEAFTPAASGKGEVLVRVRAAAGTGWISRSATAR